MTVAELQELLDAYPEDTPVVIEGRLEDPQDVIKIHDVQLAITKEGHEEIHLIAADGIRDK